MKSVKKSDVWRGVMSDYRMEIGSMIGPWDTDRLYDLLSVISEDDELEITLDANNTEQINTIVNVLKHNDFDVLNKGTGEGRKCRLIAHRIE